MTAEQMINDMIPPLKREDDLARAKQWMSEFRINELPVVENGELLGFLSEELIYDLEVKDGKIGSYPFKAKDCITAPWSHYFDILKTIKSHNMSVVAVVNNGQFMGVVILEDILNEFAETAIVNTEGAILSIQCTPGNYSLRQIAKIVEMNGAMVMGTNIKPNKEDPSLLDVVVRINHFDINQIATGLSKAGHRVISSFNTSDKTYDEGERYGQLMKFLEP